MKKSKQICPSCLTPVTLLYPDGKGKYVCDFCLALHVMEGTPQEYPKPMIECEDRLDELIQAARRMANKITVEKEG